MKTMTGRLAVLVAVTTMLVVGLLAAPAAAHPATGDWSGNDQICKFTTGCVRTGNLVRLWQSILWADGLYAGNSVSNIDGQFGPNTHNATVQWQSTHMQNDTSGQVGPHTWSTARGLLVMNDSCYSDNYLYGEYYGARDIIFLRQSCSTGYWYFVNPAGSGTYWDTNH